MRAQGTLTSPSSSSKSSSETSSMTHKFYTFAHKVGICYFVRRICAPISPIVVTVLLIQSLWIWYDVSVTSKQRHRPKRPPVKVTESMPISPFYHDPKTGQTIPWDGPTKVFPKFVVGTGVSGGRQYPCGQIMDTDATSYKTRDSTKEGLILVKEMETDSTTLGGIAARIAQRSYQKQRQSSKDSSTTTLASSATNTTSSCTVRIFSGRAKKFSNRNRDKSFLWTFVREPVDRLVHKYYHYATHRRAWAKASLKATGTKATSGSGTALGSMLLARSQSRQLPPIRPEEVTKDMISYVLNMENIDFAYYLKSLSLKQVNTYRTDLYYQSIQDLLDSYDFIGVFERWDESLAVLQLLLGLDTADMMYLPRPKAAAAAAAAAAVVPSSEISDNNIGSEQKQQQQVASVDSPFASQTDYYEYWNRQCRPIPTATVYLDMKQWFYSDEFEAYTEADVLVYKAVNKSLDLTIDSLGRDKVEKAVRDLQKANRLAQQQCKNVRLPCSSDGLVEKETDCLIPDMGVGCGYKCLDQVAKNM